MPDRQKLRETLDQLHAQLVQAGDIDPEMRSLLEGAQSELRAALESPPGEGPPAATTHPTLGARLAEAAQHFEAEHPTLTATISSLIDTLARMGI